MMHDGRTALAGVLGWPVDHSLSPRLHGYWLQKYAINGAYVPLPVQPEDLATALRGLAAVGFRGANVTVPHKQAALALCDRVEPFARQAGAVNTLLFRRGGCIVGSNTDGIGFLASLRECGVDPAKAPALIIGSGGAARAIAAAMLDVGGDVAITSRRNISALSLAEQMPGLRVIEWPVSRQLGMFGLLVNATSGGMTGQAELAFDLEYAPQGLVVADIVYAPRRTALIAEATSRGLATVEGIGMLLHQAAASFSCWFGILPEVDPSLRDIVLAS